MEHLQRRRGTAPANVCVGIIYNAVEAVAIGGERRCGGFWCVMRWYHSQMAMRWPMAMRWHVDTTKAVKPIAMRITTMLKKGWPWSSSMDIKLLQEKEMV
ncbi:hypothetical protein VNO80_09098 [Phaseolus coccineus]|uniref:Uncharacterized protein n=1 Tax=Phaseolus coccineus TaxID=3886 RepID=A0AAN9NAZ5_PHACN